VDGYFATSGYYADFMAGYLGLAREHMYVVYPGINLTGHGGPSEFRDRPPYTVGYFARICPDKGFHNLADAYMRLRRMPDVPPTRLRLSGWLGENYRSYFDEQMRTLADAGLAAEVEYVECPTHAAKVRFLQSLDVLSVPTSYREPKGIYVLEALANGVPVVQPRHGSFPELIAATGGGLLVEPEDPAALAIGLRQLLCNAPHRRRLGEDGQKAVRARFTAEQMARETAAILAQYHHRHTPKSPTPAEAVPS
jgi:glycosyltransferase involved in cell wall biosynthesis